MPKQSKVPAARPFGTQRATRRSSRQAEDTDSGLPSQAAQQDVGGGPGERAQARSAPLPAHHHSEEELVLSSGSEGSPARLAAPGAAAVEDLELQQALALSLQGCRPSPTAAPPPQAQQQQQQPAVPPAQAAARQVKTPMRGKRNQAAGTFGAKSEPVAAHQQQQQQHATQQQPQQQSRQAPQQVPTALARQQPSPAATAPRQPPSGAAPRPAAKPRQPRKRKLPAFDPSPAEVDSCFAQLSARGSGAVTIESIIQVGGVLGQELSPDTVQNMMRHAADSVLGWGNGAGRQRGAGGRLSADEFRRLVDHFRVAAA